ncbi:ABC transporter permease [Sutcliffiella cohnii]|uniref:ABC transporter permease n=1 Tax=Sutcliffiella cohnii TaxID=33932 RepID=A0A223KM53_9BACI|nr:energy-coupling factor transporter transmembrane component T [Sutcliffiella cohnii]AST90438.1 ABC transporter permease [Sutcliffiella cohnii]
MQWSLQVNETWLHRVNPSFKLIAIVLLFVAVLFIHNINVLVNMTLFMLLLYITSTGHSWKVKVVLLLPFTILFFSSAVTMILFGKGDTTWFQLGIVHISEESFYRGVHIGLRALVFAFLGLLFALTTKPVLLFYSLMQQWKLPPKYAYSFLASIRLLPIMVEEFFTLQKALKVRGIKQEKGMKAIIQKVTLYSIPLLSQSIRRAHRIAVAMEAKKFSQQKNRTYYYQVKYSKNDVIFTTVLLMVLLISFVSATFFPYFSITDVRY